MKYLLAVFAFAQCTSQTLYGQDTDHTNTQECYAVKRNNLSVELFGPGGFGSINYSRVVRYRTKWTLSARAGLGFLRFQDFENKLNPDLTFPLGISNLLGVKHKFLIGFGQVYSSTVFQSFPEGRQRNNQWNGFVELGYRIPINLPTTIDLKYTPLFPNNKTFQHWGGIQISYAF